MNRSPGNAASSGGRRQPGSPSGRAELSSTVKSRTGLFPRRDGVAVDDHVDPGLDHRELALVLDACAAGVSVMDIGGNEGFLLLPRLGCPSQSTTNVPLTTTTQWSRPSLSVATVSPASIPVVLVLICIPDASIDLDRPALDSVDPRGAAQRYVPRIRTLPRTSRA